MALDEETDTQRDRVCLIAQNPPFQVLSPNVAAEIAMTCTIWPHRGPVLAVTDMGDMWRVFRSEHTLLLRPPYVPWLVDKQTGDLLIDSPLRRDGPTARDQMTTLLNLIDPRIRALGFKGRKRRWEWTTPAGTKIMTIWAFSDATPASRTFEFQINNVSFTDDGHYGVGENLIGDQRSGFYVLAGHPVEPMAELIIDALERQLVPLLIEEP